jgi:hypothetical protein
MPDSLPKLPDNFTTLQINPDYATNLYGGNGLHWLYAPDNDGVWHPVRKLDRYEVIQAEDQRDLDIIIDGSKKTPIENKGDAVWWNQKWWKALKEMFETLKNYLKGRRTKGDQSS